MTATEVPFSKKVCSLDVCILPDDLIIDEILTWLPPESVTRFRSVCKSWCIIIKTRKFIEKHMQRAKPFILYFTPTNQPPNEDSFIFRFTLDGLVLEVNKIQGYCRIRNHATNWNILLPANDDFRRPCFLTMGYLSSTEKYKVLSLHARASGPRGHCLDVLTVGVDVTWRPVELPMISCKTSRKYLATRTVDGVSYMMKVCNEGCCPPQLFRFQIEDERFVKIRVPQRVQLLCSTGRYLFVAIDFNSKFGICCEFEGEFHIWALQDDDSKKEAEWHEIKIVFPSSVRKQHPLINEYIPHKVEGSLFYMMTHERSWLFCYDFKSNKLLSGSRMSRPIATSLVSFI